MQEKNPKEATPEWMRTLGWFGVIVSDLVVFTGLGVGVGYWLWKKQGAPVWGIILTSLLGLSLAFLQIYWMEKKRERK